MNLFIYLFIWLVVGHKSSRFHYLLYFINSAFKECYIYSQRADLGPSSNLSFVFGIPISKSVVGGRIWQPDSMCDKVYICCSDSGAALIGVGYHFAAALVSIFPWPAVVSRLFWALQYKYSANACAALIGVGYQC